MNPCPTLEACRAEGLDTRKICRAVYEKSTQVMVSRLNPRLRFLRDYTQLRPQSDACLERMDDAPFDMFVAMIGERPAGRGALYQVGDIARIIDLAVLPPFVDRGVDRALLAHVLAMAKRLAMRNICMQIDPDDPRCDWLEAIGFVSDGTIIEFERDPPSGPEGAP